MYRDFGYMSHQYGKYLKKKEKRLAMCVYVSVLHRHFMFLTKCKEILLIFDGKTESCWESVVRSDVFNHYLCDRFCRNLAKQTRPKMSLLKRE